MDRPIETPLHMPVTLMGLRVLFFLLSAAIFAPIVFSLVWSLFGTDVPGVLTATFTLKWYEEFASDPDWGAAIVNSTIVSASVGLATAVYLTWVGFSLRLAERAVPAFFVTFALVASAFPMLIYAMALKLSSQQIGLGSLATTGIGQFLIALPFAYFVVEAASENIPRNAIWSGMLLGAGPITVMRTVYAPAVWSGLSAAAIIGFLLAWDDVIMPTIILTGGSVTVPKRLWDMVGGVLQPFPAVVGTLSYAVLGLAGIALALVEAWTKRPRRGLR